MEGRYISVGTCGRGNFAELEHVKINRHRGNKGAAAEQPPDSNRRIVTEPMDRVLKKCRKADARRYEVLVKEWCCLADKNIRGHPSIIQAHEWVEDLGNGFSAIELEYAKHGDLMTYVSTHRITERQACSIAKQILQALSFLHLNGFAHRDVKPHNILVCEEHPLIVKLADFGLVKPLSMFPQQNSAGDWDFMSPQMRDVSEQHMPAEAEEYIKNDIFAVGVLLYLLLSGKMPYAHLDPRMEPNQPFLNGSLAATFPNTSNEAIQFLRFTMEVDSEKRPTADAALTHPWFEAMTRMPSTETPQRGAEALQSRQASEVASDDLPLQQSMFVSEDVYHLPHVNDEASPTFAPNEAQPATAAVPERTKGER